MSIQRNWFRRNAIGVAAAVLAMATIASGLIAAFEFVDVRSSFRRVETSEEILDHLADVMAAVLDAETGQRGFLLTGQSEYVAPYHEALKTVHSRLATLAAHDVDAAQRTRIAELQTLANLKLKELDTTLSVRQQFGFAPAAALVQAGIGNQLMDRLRTLSDEIEANERAHLALRSTDADRAVGRALLTTLLSTLSVAVLLAVTFVQVSRTTKAERFARTHAEAALDAEVAARTEADSLSRAKDQFIATVSHELRTPLTAILGWSRMLQDKAIERDFLDEGLRTIQMCAVAQKQLIEDVLDMSRIMTGKMRLQMRMIALGEAARAGVDAIRPAADAKSIRLEVDADDDVRLNADFDRIQQVVWNLVSNAVKFTPKGGTVRVSVTRIASQAEIVVSDSGEGIDSEFLPHVFEPFRQADAAKISVHKGLGLGLAIVNQIVQLHGGTIVAESDGPGKGATLRVRMPVMPFVGNIAEEVTALSAPEGGGEAPLLASRDALNGLSILVLDDHAPTLDLVGRVLSRSGAVVHAARSADEALAAAAATRLDLIVSDIGLPADNGFSLLQKLRDISGRLTPAVALTAYTRDDDRRRSVDAGFQAFLTKPVEPALLVETIAEIARRSPAPSLLGGGAHPHVGGNRDERLR